MTKFIQICASENDLFGLDIDGVIYHYNFSTNGWKRPGRGNDDRTEAAGGEPMARHEEGLNGRVRAEVERRSGRGA